MLKINYSSRKLSSEIIVIPMRMKILRNYSLQFCELSLRWGISVVIKISSCGVTYILQKKVYPNQSSSCESQLVYPLPQTCFQKKNGPSKFLFCLDEKEGGWKRSSPALKKSGCFYFLEEEGLENITQT